MAPRHIVVVTGASGAGKTAAVAALESRGVAGVRCFYFDSIGVPSVDVMERDFGSGEEWQEHATAQWLSRLHQLPDDVHFAVLDGQTRPSFVFGAADRAPMSILHVVLFDCSPDIRNARLHSPPGQADLASEQMTNWATYLRGQANALRLPVIDTTQQTVAQATDHLEAIVARLSE
jgi:hypothetical protein